MTAVPVALNLRIPHHLAEASFEGLHEFMSLVEESPIDGVSVGDHVSFRDGTGYDGLIQATALATMSSRLRIWTAVYLLALRHPVTVARQVSSLAALAPGRLAFGVGLGGDDPHELEVCGVDVRHRGRRFDAALDIVRPLLAGETVTADNPDFVVPAAVIRPTPSPPVPIVVGGRSDAALRRAGRVGDGWLGLWQSPERIAAAIDTVEASAAEHGRASDVRRYAYLVWCGLDPDRDAARSLVADAMERLYGRPFSSFERYTPAGTPEDVAAALAPYMAAGIDEFILIGVAAEDTALVDRAAQVRERLTGLQT